MIKGISEKDFDKLKERVISMDKRLKFIEWYINELKNDIKEIKMWWGGDKKDVV